MNMSKITKINLHSTGKSVNQISNPPIPPPLNLSNNLTKNLSNNLSSNLPMSSKDLEFEHYDFTTPLNTIELKKCKDLNSSLSSSNGYSIEFASNGKENKFKNEKHKKRFFNRDNQMNQDTNCNDKSASEFAYESAPVCKLPNNESNICVPNSLSTNSSSDQSLSDQLNNERSTKQLDPMMRNKILIQRKKVYNKSKNCLNSLIVSGEMVCPNRAYQCPINHQKCVIKRQPIESDEKLSNRCDFILFCIGSSINLFNVWRFPYLCYKNNGGTFLIAYFVCSIVIGFPLLLIELTLGQYSKMNSVNLFKNLVPIFKGLGNVTVITSIVTTVYLNLILSYILIYLLESCRGMKWKKCDPTYSSSNCTNLESFRYGMINRSSFVIPSEDFFNNQILNKSSTEDQLTKINWTVLFALLFTWFILFTLINLNVRNTGRIIYFVATFPYLCLFFVFLKSITLNSAADGLVFYIVPNINKLKDVHLWTQAAIQVFYSFGLANGSILTYATHNRFYNPVVNYAALVWSINILTSLFVCFIMFSILGFYSSIIRRPVGSVLSSGIGLLFVVIPDQLANNTSWPVLWSSFYFLILFIIGLNTQLSSLEIICTFLDNFKNNKKKSKKLLNYFGLFSFMILLSLPFSMKSGAYLLEITDHYANGLIYLSIALMEFLIVSYMFGISNFFDLLKVMKCCNPKILVKSHLTVLITTICPLILIYLINVNFVQVMNLRDALQSQNFDKSEMFFYFICFLHLFNLSLVILGCLNYVFVQKLEKRFMSRADQHIGIWIKIRYGLEANSKFKKNYNQNTVKLIRCKGVPKYLALKKYQTNCGLHKGNKAFKNRDSVVMF